MNNKKDLKKNLKSVGINFAAVALAVAIGIPVGNSLLRQFRSTTSSSAPVPTTIVPEMATILFKNVTQDVIVFGDTKCNFCKEGISLLDKLGVNYKVYYIDQDEEAKETFRMLNAEGVPVLISRSQVLIGFERGVWEKFTQTDHVKRQ